MTNISLAEALRDNPAAPAGWWTSEDGCATLDMTGATVAEAFEEMAGAYAYAPDAVAFMLAGTIEVLDEDSLTGHELDEAVRLAMIQLDC